MRAATGQALRWCQRIIRVLVPLALLAGLGLGVLAWRLAEGPLPLPVLARQIEQAVNEDSAVGLRLQVGEAAIAWEGWRSGAAAAVDIRLAGVRLRDAAGALRADLPDVAFTLSVPALLTGRLAPGTIELRQPSLLVSREADGRISLGAAPDAAAVEPVATDAAPPQAGAEPPDAPGGTPIIALLEALRRPSPEGEMHVLADFRRLRIQGGNVLVLDRRLGRRWSLGGLALDLRRGRDGDLVAEGSATAQGVGLAIPVRIAASLPAESPARLGAEVTLPALRPAELAVLWPELAPLRLLDAAVALTASARFDGAGVAEQVRARLTSRDGALDLGGGRRLPFATLDATLEGGERQLRLSEAALRLAGPGAPALRASGRARRDGDGWAARLDLGLDPVAMASLPALWPESLATAARGTALAALQGGTLREARLAVGVRADADFANLRLEAAEGGLVLEDAALGLGAAAAQAAPAAFAEGSDAWKSLRPEMRLLAERVEVAAALSPGHVRLTRLGLRLPAPEPGAAAVELALAGEARQADAGGWEGEATLSLDALRLADLPRLWPEGLRPNEREWLTGNVTAGELRQGRWRLAGAMPEGPESLALTAFEGSAEAVDATVHWLRPVPPIVGLNGTAQFSREAIVIRAQGGRQARGEEGRAAVRAARSGAPPRPGGLELREGTVRFSEFDTAPGRAEIEAQVAGPLPDLFALLRHPRLKLFERKPLEIGAAAGQVDARLTVAFPLLSDLPFERVALRATGRIAEARVTDVLLGHALERANLDVTVDTDGLKLSGQGSMVEAPARFTVEMDFRAGAPTQVTERAQASIARADAAQLAAFGLDTVGLMGGTVGVEARYERRRGGQGSVALRGDLREARLALDALGWVKPIGQPGSGEATLRLANNALTAVEGLRLEAPGLALRGRIGFGAGNRLDRVEIAAGSRLGQTRLGAEIRRPAREGGAWNIALRGPLLDLQPILSGTAEAPAEETRRPQPGPGTGPRLSVEARFDRATTGEGRNLHAVALAAEVDGNGLLRAARATGRAGPGEGAGFELALTPQGRERHLRLEAADGGALLHALDVTDAIAGGRLTVHGVYPELRPGAPLSGTAELDSFAVRNAPALGKLLQAMTLFGLVEAMQGGNGLVFLRLVAPFALTPEALVLEDARAFSASLGLTAKGRLWRQRRVVDIEGTVVPAYFFNQLLGNIPLIGRLFSPERGGGVFAATYRVQGPSNDPSVSVNPLAALTPGFLRGLFGLGQGEGQAGR